MLAGRWTRSFLFRSPLGWREWATRIHETTCGFSDEQPNWECWGASVLKPPGVSVLELPRIEFSDMEEAKVDLPCCGDKSVRVRCRMVRPLVSQLSVDWTELSGLGGCRRLWRCITYDTDCGRYGGTCMVLPEMPWTKWQSGDAVRISTVFTRWACASSRVVLAKALWCSVGACCGERRFDMSSFNDRLARLKESHARKALRRLGQLGQCKSSCYGKSKKAHWWRMLLPTDGKG